eukprot:GEMP01096428.1.p1 GENE.GEMP01096428.1~~GEMP01096428.1.p1  ORF type:complete len:136 (+),score=2.96 GEMP01096428.1:274-681(+)
MGAIFWKLIRAHLYILCVQAFSFLCLQCVLPFFVSLPLHFDPSVQMENAFFSRLVTLVKLEMIFVLSTKKEEMIVPEKFAGDWMLNSEFVPYVMQVPHTQKSMNGKREHCIFCIAWFDFVVRGARTKKVTIKKIY